MIKKEITNNSGNFYFFGNGVGDDKLNLQLAKYIEKDKLMQDIYKSQDTNEDPFKKRDEKYMKFKYRIKNSRNLHPYLTSEGERKGNLLTNEERREKSLKDNVNIHRSTENFREKLLLGKIESQDSQYC